MIEICVIILAGYLLGAIPFGLIIGLSKGVDIRQSGSGNIGATNAGRLLGKKWGYLCMILDMLKGFIPVMVMHLIIGHRLDISVLQVQLAMLAVAAAAISGHLFSVFIKFKGGKGVATSLGVLLGIYPFMTIASSLAFGVWIIVYLSKGYVSLASIISGFSLPVVFLILTYTQEQWQMPQIWPSFVFSCLVGFMIVFRHRSNITRLLAGTESKNRRV